MTATRNLKRLSPWPKAAGKSPDTGADDAATNGFRNS